MYKSPREYLKGLKICLFVCLYVCFPLFFKSGLEALGIRLTGRRRAGSAVLGVKSPQIWRHGPFAEERAHFHFPIMKGLEHGFIYSPVQAVMLGQCHLTSNGQISCQSEIRFTRIGSSSSSWGIFVFALGTQ